MITKLHRPHSNLVGTLRYNFKKVENDEAIVLYTRNLNFISSEEVSYLETKNRMYAGMPTEYRTKNITFHASINPHSEDNLSDATIEFFIDDYLEQLGYGKQPYIVFKHEDIDRVHYHIVSLNVDKNGDKINDRFIRKRSWNILKELSKKYGIKPPNQHFREVRSDLLLNPPTPIIYKEGNIVEQIRIIVDYSMELYKPKSIGELSAILLGYNINLDTIRNNNTGENGRDGLLYSIIDEENNRLSVGVKAGDLGFHYLKQQLDIQFQENKKAWSRKAGGRIKFTVAWALRNAKKPSSFVENMSELGVNVLFRFNNEGRIYGVTYIDTKRGVVCNGSDLGKDYSANALDDYFNNRSEHHWPINTNRDKHIKIAITRALSNNLTYDEFCQSMGDQGIDVLSEKNENGDFTNIIFADNRHYVVVGTNEMSDHYSTALFQNYFQEGGPNFWKEDYKLSERALYSEKNMNVPNYSDTDTDSTLFDDVIDSLADGVHQQNALAIGRMYQRQAERRWNPRNKR